MDRGRTTVSASRARLNQISADHSGYLAAGWAALLVAMGALELRPERHRSLYAFQS